MTQASPDWAARARKAESLLLQRLAAVGLDAAAEACGVDASTVSRWKGKEIPVLSRLAARLGLKLVPAEMRCFRNDDIEALLTLAKSRLQLIAHAEQLAEDDA